MATKSLTITETAYELLEAHKRPDESFTDVIVRIAGGQGDRMAGFGTLEDAETFRASVEATRDELDEDLRARHDQ